MIDQNSLWIVVLGAIGATYSWRFGGVLLAKKINTESAVFQWFTCVSYAMLAGLVSRMVLLPVGPLTEASLGVRLICLGTGLALFLFAGRKVLLSVGCALGLFIMLVSLA